MPETIVSVLMYFQIWLFHLTVPALRTLIVKTLTQSVLMAFVSAAHHSITKMESVVSWNYIIGPILFKWFRNKPIVFHITWHSNLNIFVIFQSFTLDGWVEDGYAPCYTICNSLKGFLIRTRLYFIVFQNRKDSWTCLVFPVQNVFSTGLYVTWKQIHVSVLQIISLKKDSVVSNSLSLSTLQCTMKYIAKAIIWSPPKWRQVIV